MNLSKWIVLFLVSPCSFKAMEPASPCLKLLKPHSSHSYFSEKEKNLLLQMFLTSKTILDDDQNNVLHMAAALHEYPELTQELLLNRPELATYLDTPNKKGVTPGNLMLQMQTTKNARVYSDNRGVSITTAFQPSLLKGSQVTVIQIPKQNIQESIEELDKSIHAKVLLMNQGLTHEPYTLAEKARILRILIDLPHPTGGTPLHGAVDFQGYPELTKDLLAFKPELRHLMNTPDGFGITPLKRAIIRNNWSAVETLMAAGASENP